MNIFKHEPGWSHTTIDSHDCELFIPSTVNEHGYVLLYLHDVDGSSLQSRPLIEAQLEKYQLPCISPQTGHSWWADHVATAFHSELTPERFVRENVMSWIMEHPPLGEEADQPRVALFGIGMGGQGALRMSYKFPDQFPIVAAIAPDLDYHFRVREGDEALYAMYGDTESARQDTAILHIHPLNWPRHQYFCADPEDYHTFEGADRLRMKLASTGIMFDVDTETKKATGKDYIDTMTKRAFRFLSERLDRERQRFV